MSDTRTKSLFDLEELPQDYVGPMKRLLTNEELKPFLRTSGGLAVLFIALEFLGIVAMAWLCERFWGQWAIYAPLYVFALFWIGARAHGLGVIAHDASHYSLFKNRKVNEFVGEVFLAWPILVTLRSYRRGHLAHHANLNTPKDPDYIRNRPDLLPEQRTALDVLLLFLGKGTEQAGLAQMFLGDKDNPRDRELHLPRALFYLAAAAVITLLGGWKVFLLYWVAPVLTTFPLAMRLRGVMEHWAVENENPLNKSRTTELGLFGKLFFLPHNINLHIDHHYYPRVPFYRLPALHRRLLQVPAYRENAHITKGSHRAFAEIFRYPGEQRARAAGSV